MIFKKFANFAGPKVYAAYYRKNNTLYYNTAFDRKNPKIIAVKLELGNA